MALRVSAMPTKPRTVKTSGVQAVAELRSSRGTGSSVPHLVAPRSFPFNPKTQTKLFERSFCLLLQFCATSLIPYSSTIDN